jgi:hypothetical protein
MMSVPPRCPYSDHQTRNRRCGSHFCALFACLAWLSQEQRSLPEPSPSLRLRQMYRHRVFCARQTASLSRYPDGRFYKPQVLLEVQALGPPAASPAHKVHPGGRPRLRACRLYSLQRSLSRPASAPRTRSGTFGGFASASEVCVALRSLNRNPTILSRLRVIVKPFAEALYKPFSAPVARSRRPVALVSDACLRNPPIMPYAYADVKGLRGNNFSRRTDCGHPAEFL